MAGHSKFANIKHKKEKQDSKRAKLFTKFGKELSVAVKMGGADPGANNRLRDVIAKAKANNMPNDNIDRAIKKAAGDKGSANFEAFTYEGFGPGGVAVMVETLSDNRTRTVSNVRAAFNRGEGNLGVTGSVNFQFDHIGQITVLKADDICEEDLMMLVLEAGATDVLTEEEGYEIITEPNSLGCVLEAMEAAAIPVLTAEVIMQPKLYTTLTDPLDIKNMNKILNTLEDDDDVQAVFHNWEE
ncbi:MAG: YebC/PmpR family DNA-binding transcriptional regulator [Clostridiales bacterium]|jgi:YebC/PmpR family DNA-binding regulatory protein|nr:YebC/PmpR family DNA-binding transcriptional regulator [Clostridiales bacterium]